ncbi:MAG: hypothetical protein KDD48_06715 [Bdellovibrionales bacterium]|nr:hypothetical protein [Bdellovibrionales bacterium]
MSSLCQSHAQVDLKALENELKESAIKHQVVSLDLDTNNPSLSCEQQATLSTNLAALSRNFAYVVYTQTSPEIIRASKAHWQTFFQFRSATPRFYLLKLHYNIKDLRKSPVPATQVFQWCNQSGYMTSQCQNHIRGIVGQLDESKTKNALTEAVENARAKLSTWTRLIELSSSNDDLVILETETIKDMIGTNTQILILGPCNDSTMVNEESSSQDTTKLSKKRSRRQEQSSEPTTQKIGSVLLFHDQLLTVFNNNYEAISAH